MKTLRLCFLLIVCCFNNVLAQVGVGTTNPDAVLDIRSSNQATPANNDGLLIPKIDEFPLTNPTALQEGMMVFVTGNGTPTKGFYYWDNTTTSWISATGAKRINDLTDGKSDNDGTDNGSSIFLGVDAGLNDDGTDNENVAFGFQTLKANTSGSQNVASGYQALHSNTTGYLNTALGDRSLTSNDTGIFNTAVGFRTMFSNNNGQANTAVGGNALYGNSSGGLNTAVGQNSLTNNTTGNFNSAIGFAAGSYVRGDNNTFLGTKAGFSSGLSTRNLSGSIFLGFEAGTDVNQDNRLYIENSNSTQPLIYGEFDNDILGFNANVGIGNQTPEARLHVTEEGTAGVQTIVAGLASNTSNRPVLQFSETNDIGLAEGMSLEYNGTGVTAFNRMVINAVGGAPLFEFRNSGLFSLIQGDIILNNDGTDLGIIMQDAAGNNDRVLMRQTGTQDIYVGDIDNNNGDLYLRAGGSTELSILSTSGFVGVNTTTPNYTFEVNGNAAKPGSATWTVTSDRRLKHNINTYEDGLETVLGINPVTYQYNQKSGFEQTEQHVGVIAQELQEIAPYMVTSYTKKDTDYLAVDNSAMTYMLINAIKEQQHQIESLKEIIDLQNIELNKIKVILNKKYPINSEKPLVVGN